MGLFSGKVAVITGAGSGIGRALAVELASRGAKLALSGRRTRTVEETLKLLPAGAQAKVYQVDVSNREQVFAHAEDVKRDFGTAHFVFNNAGATLVGTIENLTIEEIEWQLGINLWGVIYGTKAFLPMLLAQREGHIVNISSVFGLVGFPAQGAYNISKFGVRGLTECLWRELEGTGVQAVCVHPGGVKTNIDSSGRTCANAGPQEKRFGEQSEHMLTTSPERCALDILRGIERGRRRILSANGSQVLSWLPRLLPEKYPAVIRRLFH